MEIKLEKLLNKIEEDGKKEVELLEKDAQLEIEKIRKEGEMVYQQVREEEDSKLEKEKRRFLEDYRKEKEFKLNMEILELKTNLFKKATKEAQKDGEIISSQEKQEIFKKIVENINHPISESSRVSVNSSLKLDFLEGLSISKESIFRNNTDNDFTIEDTDFIIEVSLSAVIEERVNKESDFFAKLLFKK